MKDYFPSFHLPHKFCFFRFILDLDLHSKQSQLVKNKNKPLLLVNVILLADKEGKRGKKQLIQCDIHPSENIHILIDGNKCFGGGF